MMPTPSPRDSLPPATVLLPSRSPQPQPSTRSALAAFQRSTSKVLPVRPWAASPSRLPQVRLLLLVLRALDIPVRTAPAQSASSQRLRSLTSSAPPAPIHRSPRWIGAGGAEEV